LLGVAVNVVNCPAQIVVPGLAAIAILGTSTGLITTFVVAAALVHPATVTVTLYVPAIAVVVLGLFGFCVADV
jgi:hypothetical protein